MPQRDGSPRRSGWSRLLRWVVAALTAALLVRVAADNWNDLDDVSFTLTVGWLVAALGAMVLATVLLVAGWRVLLGAYGWTLRWARAHHVWALSQATRYIPSGLVPVFARTSLTAADGLPAAVASTTVVVETLALLGHSTLLAALLGVGDWLALPWRVVVGVGAVVGLTALVLLLGAAGGSGTLAAALTRTLGGSKAGAEVGPAQGADSRTGGRAASKRGRGGAAAVEALSAERRLVAAGVGVLGAGVVVRVVAYALVGAAVLGYGATAANGATGTWMADALLVAGASAGAIVVGMVGVTPAGLGVREAVAAALLADRFGLGEAAAFTVVLRASELAVELAYLAVVSLMGRRP